MRTRILLAPPHAHLHVHIPYTSRALHTLDTRTSTLLLLHRKRFPRSSLLESLVAYIFYTPSFIFCALRVLHSSCRAASRGGGEYLSERTLSILPPCLALPCPYPDAPISRQALNLLSLAIARPALPRSLTQPPFARRSQAVSITGDHSFSRVPYYPFPGVRESLRRAPGRWRPRGPARSASA